MQIASTQNRIASRLPQTVGNLPTPISQSVAGHEPVDIVANLPSNWQDIDTQPVRFPDSSPPALQRPVVFLHGFNGSAERWDHVFEWLTSGEEPVNKSGGIIDAGKLDNIDPQANLFSLRLSRPYNTIQQNKAELKQAVEAVLSATGAKEVDLVVHSLGGLNTRHYLQDEDEKVNKVVMLGTPNHGSQLANLELFFRRNFGYPILPPVDDPDVRTLLGQMSVDKLDGDKKPENPFLRSLNDDWGQHKNAAEIMIVAGAGVPTLTGAPGVTIFGDGVVARRSAQMDGVENKTAWFRTHGGLQNSAQVMENTAKFLVGQRLSPGENLFDSPEDAIRAVELMTAQSSSEAKRSGKATPEEVKQATRLPLLDPAFQIGLGLGVLSAIMGGPKENLPLVEIALSSENRQNEIHANYNIDLLRSENPLRGGGSVNNDSFAEVANLKEGKLHWHSALGLKSSGLVMEVGEDERSVTMKGDLGGVPTDLTLAMVQDDRGRMSGMKTTGTFNGEAYSVESSINLEGLFMGQPLHHSSMKVSGVVNGENLDRTYQVNVHRNDKGLEFSAQQDVQAQSGQSLGVVVKILDRDKV